MPSTADVFGPQSSNVTLDGSGNGTVYFQAVGGSKRITNLFCKVSSATLQAQCSLYVGNVSDNARVFISNSGSTGFNARGSIDLIDGQILYVVWTGGDAGAIATATFTGKSINFSELSTSEIVAEDPIAAGDGTLIFPAIKSPNYVAGVSGWYIGRDGSIEANNITARGTLNVVGADNSFIKTEFVGGYPRIAFKPPNTGFTNFDFDMLTSPPYVLGTRTQGATEGDCFTELSLIGGVLGGGTAAGDAGMVLIQSSTYDTSAQVPTVKIASTDIAASGNPVVKFIVEGDWYNDYGSTGFGTDMGRGRIFNTGMPASSGAIGATETSVITFPSFTFKANRAYRAVVCGLFSLSVAGNRPIFKIRKTNTAGAIIAQTGKSSQSTGQEDMDWNGEFWIGGTDVTASLVYTAVGSGAFNVTVLSGSGVTFYDIGPAADYSYKTQLT